MKRALAAGGLLANAGAQPNGALRAVEIAATAYGGTGSATRDAILEVGAQKQGWVRVLAWSRRP